MSVTTTEGNSIGSEIFGGTAHAAVGTWYAALFTASPGAGGVADDEVSGGSYARVAVTNNVTNFPAMAALAGASGAAIAFPMATADWGYVTHVGLCAAATPGVDDVKHYGPITPVVILSGTTPTFAIAGLTWSLA